MRSHPHLLLGARLAAAGGHRFRVVGPDGGLPPRLHDLQELPQLSIILACNSTASQY